LNRVRILIADRERDHADSLRMLFEIRGCVVLCAENSHDALSLISVHRPDALIVELDMLGSSSLCAAARQGNPAGAFVVGIAGVKLDPPSCEVVMRLVKPYNFDGLARQMDSFLQERAAQKRSANGGTSK
jgi:DNA-binding response OmpR family regulator